MNEKKEAAKIIWVLKKDSRGQECTTINLEGSVLELMVGLKNIVQDIATNIAEKCQVPPDTVRSVVLGWLSDGGVVNFEEGKKATKEETT